MVNHVPVISIQNTAVNKLTWLLTGGTRKQKMVSKTHLGVGPSFCTKIVMSRFHDRRMYWPLTALRPEGALAEVGVGRVNEEWRSQRPGKFLDNAPECT